MRSLSSLLVLLLSVGVPTASAAVAPSASGLRWSWADDVERTWYVQNEVQLPSFVWVSADRNKEARLIAYATRMVLTCAAKEPSGRKSTEVRCRVDDFAIRGATVAGDAGLLQPILDEMDDKVTGAHLDIVLRHDGRVTNIDLEDVRKGNRRESVMQETIRVLLSRAIAGFDLQLPRNGVSEDGVWAQYQGILMAAPTDQGSQGSGEVAHMVRGLDAELVIIESAGRGMVVPAQDGAAGQNFYETTLDTVAVFDVQHGMMRERVWSAIGTPTASSTITVGGAGIRYFQSGKILALDPGDARPELGPNLEVGPPDTAVDSAILTWGPATGTPP